MNPEIVAEVGNEDAPESFRSGFIAVIGRPNVGKSTLLNQVLGQKIAITSDKPQTTRDQILGIRTDGDAQLIFLDTPGIHQPRNRLGKHMVNVAEQAIASDSDVILWLVDISAPPSDEDHYIVERLRELLDFAGELPFLLLIANKVDSIGTVNVEDRIREYVGLLGWLTGTSGGQKSIPVRTLSAATGDGVDALVASLAELVPPGPLYYPSEQVTDLSMRFIAAEIVREKALQLLRQEIPHSLAVSVTEWNERSPEMTHIAATLYVERHSQKGIVLGGKGSMIKEIGQAARPEIEEMVGTRVYLELWVKVLQKWRRKENLLRRLGYHL
ncbi:MAG: GTPase Era [Caldilineaceae bacterium SB0675_bin_29]|uniref:GTPase Era n=1 Tax=Caldilineaceae bacterium SB0675_bin_29 TaxID=2605266 RepID=A0A6B1G0H4_9CHLR|nr:GTPase Era [Caldilineaceae bacterium SB0675_bin_29]